MIPLKQPMYFDYKGKRYTFIGRKIEDRTLFIYYHFRQGGPIFRMTAENFFIIKENAKEEFNRRKYATA